jgi:hypothetical protein
MSGLRKLCRELKSPLASTMPAAVVEQQGSAELQGSVAAIRLTRQNPAHLTALGHEAECPDKLAAPTESLNDHADAGQEHRVLLLLALAVEMLVRKPELRVQGTAAATCLRWMFEEHCPCLGTQLPSF